MQKYYVLMGYALTAKPSTLHSEFYIAGDADAHIVELKEQNRKMRHALTLITDETRPDAIRIARECLSMVGPTSS